VSDTAAASAAKRTRSPGHETNLAPSRTDDNSHQGEVKHKAIPKVSEPKIAHLDRDDVGHGHITEPPQDTTQEEDNGKVHVDVDLEAPEVAAGDEAVEDKGHSEDCAAEGEVPETDQPQASGDGEHLEDDKASQADENQGDNEDVAGSAAEDEAPAASEDEGQAKDDSQAAGETAQKVRPKAMRLRACLRLTTKTKATVLTGRKRLLQTPTLMTAVLPTPGWRLPMARRTRNETSLAARDPAHHGTPPNIAGTSVLWSSGCGATRPQLHAAEFTSPFCVGEGRLKNTGIMGR
jgi:hypothetical protein